MCHNWYLVALVCQILTFFCLFVPSSLLQNLCHILYDAFRPLIIHMNHMETLTELCSILKVRMHRNNILLYIFTVRTDLAVFLLPQPKPLQCMSQKFSLNGLTWRLKVICPERRTLRRGIIGSSSQTQLKWLANLVWTV